MLLKLRGSIRRKLIYLVVLATFPVFAVLISKGFVQRNEDVRSAVRDTTIFLRSFSEVQQRTTDSTRTLLRTVSEMPEIKRGDVEGSKRILSTLLKANPIYTNVILLDAKGDVIVMGKGENKGYNFSDRKQFRDAMRTGKFAYGEFVIGKATKKSIFPFAIPVMGEMGIPQGAIIIGVNLGQYRDLYDKSEFTDGSFFGISDHNGIRLFRYPAPDSAPMGVPIKQAVFDSARRSGAPGIIETTASDGVDRIIAYVPLRLTPEGLPYMYMFIGLDRSKVVAAANEDLLNSAIVSGLSLCLALSLAWLLGWRSIAAKLDQLTLSVQKIGQGDEGVTSGLDYKDGEIGLLAQSFDTMSSLLRMREKDLQKAKEAAESANKTKDEFLANISHEVRTPLNGVMGMLQLLQDTKVDNEQRSFLITAFQSSRNLLRVLNDLLDFIKVGSGKLELLEEPFDLEGLVQQSVDLFQLQLEEKDVALEFHIDPGVRGQYSGDVGRIRQILFNLIGNAIKFTESGTIGVEVYMLPHPVEGRDRLFFSIEDTGVGIPDDKIDSIFDAFTQVDGSFSRGHQGTGLGLPIVKKLVTLMGGNCVIESEIGIGTTVLFCVLVGEAEAVLGQDNENQTTTPLIPLNVLLVEDEKVNQIMAKRLLEKMGHSVVCAGNGQECLTRIGEHDFDAILMDIQMPVLDGLATTRQIRSDQAFSRVANIPIIALSAHAAESDIDKAFQAGVDEYIVKPFEKKALEEALSSVRISDESA